MNSASEEPAGREERLHDLIACYLEANEKGQEPDRKELLRRNPDLGDDLQRFFADHDRIARMGAPLRDLGSATESRPFAAPLGELGDFRIGREIGRGGMGIVYEAEQISLGRKVALKVLPFASTLDGKQLQRFKNEAHAAAQLHHTNIVPVYATGCERGVHYYAMQYIEGQTVAAVISAFRRLSGREPQEACTESAAAPRQEPVCGRAALEPQNQSPGSTDRRSNECSNGTSTESPMPQATAHSSERARQNAAYFRTLTQLGIQAALALQHAHQLGIIHRDIKPGNLLLETSSPLAPLGVEGGDGLRLWVADFGLAHCQSNRGLTMTGDLVGTLHYMSPEQALGTQVAVDHRSDIYSLGMTLYELLTLEPAYAGRDREEILRRIAFEEPQLPRRLNKAIPAELETIVLKAIEKNPADRYATAQELADDLERFLKDEPIRARRPSVWAKTKKWSRRHRPVVLCALVAGGVLLLLGVAGLAVNNRQIAGERDEKNAALEVAQSQRQRAEANLHRALDAIERMLLQVNDKELVSLPGVGKFQLKMCEEALELCQQLLAAVPTDPAARYCTARAYLLTGTLRFALGQTAAGQEAARKGFEICQELVHEFPDFAAYRTGWAQACHAWGVQQRQAGRFQEAERSLQQATVLWKDMAKEQASSFEIQEKLAGSLEQLGYLYWRMDRTMEAEGNYGEALKLARELAEGRSTPPAWRGTGLALQLNILNSLGVLFRTNGRWPEAERSFRQVLAIEEEPGVTSPDQAGRAHGHLGIVLWQLGRNAEAEQHLRQPLQGADPLSLESHEGMALSQRWLDQFLAWVGRAAEAEVGFRKVLRVQEELVKRYPVWEPHKVNLATSRQMLANLYRDTGRPEEANPFYRQALGFQEQDAADHPDDMGKHLSLGGTAQDFGQLLFDQGKSPQAGAAFQTAAQAFEQALRLSPNHYRAPYCLARFRTVCFDPQLRDTKQAVEYAERAVRLAPQDPSCWNALGMARYRAGYWQEAADALERSMSLRSGGNSFDWFFLAMAHAQLGDLAEARQWQKRAVEWMEKYRPRDLELLHLRAEAGALIQS